jgi:hypothetical protein
MDFNMEWFSLWWQGLGIAGQIMACAAIPMTVVMLMQLILMIIGAGFGMDSDGDVDSDGVDAGTESPTNEAASYGSSIFKIFTIRGIVAFFALGGWAGLAALSAGVPTLWAIQIALLVGVAALIIASVVIRLALRMQDSGNLDLQNALAQPAEVYITIPPSRTNTGKVTMLLQDRFVEIEAMTDNETAISPRTKVEVVGIANKNCLLVKPAADE